MTFFEESSQLKYKLFFFQKDCHVHFQSNSIGEMRLMGSNSDEKENLIYRLTALFIEKSFDIDKFIYFQGLSRNCTLNLHSFITSLLRASENSNIENGIKPYHSKKLGHF